MRRPLATIIVLLSLIISVHVLFSSCEKDFIEDEDCITNIGDIPGWDEPQDTTAEQTRDSINGGFVVSVNEWGDTIRHELIINK